MTSNQFDQDTHTDPEDCSRARTVDFDREEPLFQGDKIAYLGECTVCGRKFERVFYYSHDTCYEPEWEDLYLSPQPK